MAKYDNQPDISFDDSRRDEMMTKALGRRLPTPEPSDLAAQWQVHYNVWFTYYAWMSLDFWSEDPRARQRGLHWAHQMVEASLGAGWWMARYARSSEKLRSDRWKILVDHAVVLDDDEFIGRTTVDDDPLYVKGELSDMI